MEGLLEAYGRQCRRRRDEQKVTEQNLAEIVAAAARDAFNGGNQRAELFKQQPEPQSEPDGAEEDAGVWWDQPEPEAD